MRYSKLKSSAIEVFTHTNQLVVEVEGKPGGGKSTLAREIIRALGGTPENTVEFNPSLRQPVDVLGTPRNINLPYTEWVPPIEFYKLREGVGECFLLIEERGDADPDMQNVLCRIVYDRYAGDFALSKKLRIITTTNKTEHKSGAYRTSTKLAARMVALQFDEHIDDWVLWALEHNVDPRQIQFLRYRPALLSDFDPSRERNPLPRTWEYVSKIPDTLPDDEYFEWVAGAVGEGAASEFIGFKRIYDKLPSIDEILQHPDKTPVPTDPAVNYALSDMLARKVEKDNFDRLYGFIERMAPEYKMMTVTDAAKKKSEILNTRTYIKWATENAKYVL